MLKNILKVLEEDGACLAMNKYKELINIEYDGHEIADSEYKNYKNLLKIIIEAKRDMCYCPSKKLGIMYYNPSMVSDEKCIELVYKILQRKDDSAALPDTERIRND